MVDASVFVHAFLKKRGVLKPHERLIKDSAKRIVARINEGEKVCITAVQVAEVANILEKYMPLGAAQEILYFLLYSPSVKVFGVDREDLVRALEVSRQYGVGLSDAVAYVVAVENGVDEIYSFDKDFDKFKELKRVTN